MNIIELLSANPGVELKVKYNITLDLFFVTACNGSKKTINPIVLTALDAKDPKRFEETIKRAVEVVK